jgi:uncharacterized protein (DUF1778 family)
MSTISEIPTHLNMRIDPKLRYLADLAARARGKSLTDYIEAAIQESFKTVSLDQFPELTEEPNVYELSPQERQERFKARRERISSPLSDYADSLWSENPLVRLQMLSLSGFDHLVSEDDKATWKYILSRRELKSEDGKLNLKLISERLSEIKSRAVAESKKKGSK